MSPFMKVVYNTVKHIRLHFVWITGWEVHVTVFCFFDKDNDKFYLLIQAMLTHWTKKIIVEEGYTFSQLVHML